MAKRPTVDLMALTADHATPPAEAAQRASAPPAMMPTTSHTKTGNLEALAFKVSPQFRKRFKQRAVAADLKLNELLFASLAAWEEKNRM